MLIDVCFCDSYQVKRRSSLQSQMKAQHLRQEEGIAEIHGMATVILKPVVVTNQDLSELIRDLLQVQIVAHLQAQGNSCYLPTCHMLKRYW